MDTSKEQEENLLRSKMLIVADRNERFAAIQYEFDELAKKIKQHLSSMSELTPIED